MNKQSIISEALRKADEKFPCLVKPVGYTFTKSGKKIEVEGMTDEKDSVLRFLSTTLSKAIDETLKAVRVEEKQKTYSFPKKYGNSDRSIALEDGFNQARKARQKKEEEFKNEMQ